MYLREETDWQQDAACRNYPYPQDWFDMSVRYLVVRARVQSVCDRCPVLHECEAFVDMIEQDLPLRHMHGFWAGQTPKERWWRRDRERRIASQHRKGRKSRVA